MYVYKYNNSKIITVYVCKNTLVHLNEFGNYDLIKTPLEKNEEEQWYFGFSFFYGK